MIRKILLAAAILLMSAFGAWAQDVQVIHAGWLMDVPGEGFKENQTIIVRDGVITEVRDGFVDPATLEGDVSLIDLSDEYVLPGLIDMHVHLTGQLGPARLTEGFFMEDSEVALRASMYARRTLEAGFTTVRNAGADPKIMIGLRNAIDKGYVPGPRIIFANPVRITGGHGDGSSYRVDVMEFIQGENVCDGADECAKATRNAIKLGGDWIKIAATGGVLTNTNTGTDQQMSDEEMAAIVTAARRMGRKVAAHAHGAAGLKAALRAGVATIEHGTYMDDEAVRLFNQTGAYYVPTVLAGVTVMEMAQNTNALPPAIAEKALTVGPLIMGALRKAHNGGVKIAFGTDSGVSAHGQNAREFQLMVEAGMSPEETIIAATLTAAEALDMQDQFGSIEAGKSADIIAVSDNPLEDISTLRQVSFVMAGGAVIKDE